MNDLALDSTKFVTISLAKYCFSVFPPLISLKSSPLKRIEFKRDRKCNYKRIRYLCSLSPHMSVILSILGRIHMLTVWGLAVEKEVIG